MGRIAVVVLGDIGRSPRMKCHSISLASHGHRVDLIGYGGSTPHRSILENERITLRHLAEPPAIGGLIGLIVKCIWQACTLLWCLLFVIESPRIILLQNPPGLPALFVCWMVARLKRAKWIVDWHNYTWSIMRLKWGMHPFVRLVRRYEYLVGSWADHAFSVSERMKFDLEQECGGCIRTDTFYDRPLRGVFRAIRTVEERHEVMQRMGDLCPEIFRAESSEDSNIFTEQSKDGSIRFRPDRPALLISSTSWTEDEDFGKLFDAVSIYDRLSTERPRSLPRVVLVITGKGPLKEYYLARLPAWTRVRLCTPWLPAEDYPRLLASADLGLCLHESSSGVDLPMKGVDMLGCRLPVVALEYAAIDELIKDGTNGRLFDSAESLAAILAELLDGFPRGKLSELKKRLDESRGDGDDRWDWETNWDVVVKPVVNGFMG